MWGSRPYENNCESDGISDNRARVIARAGAGPELDDDASVPKPERLDHRSPELLRARQDGRRALEVADCSCADAPAFTESDGHRCWVEAPRDARGVTGSPHAPETKCGTAVVIVGIAEGCSPGADDVREPEGALGALLRRGRPAAIARRDRDRAMFVGRESHHRWWDRATGL